GTLVLDELASISLRTQEKILRIIEYGELQRVGGSDTFSVDIRIVGSTNADLQALVAAGRFRVDLLDRLAFDVVTIPPLRERLEDILPLAYAFALNMASELKYQYFPGFGARASSALLRYDWPGNVRELKNAVERSVYRSAEPGKQITSIVFDPFDSPFRLRESAIVESSAKRKSVIRSTPILPTDINTRVQELEVELLKAGLEKARFNQRLAADLLGLSYHQLRGKIRKYSLDIRKSEVG
ncbi:MAG: sigma 54-interacting transcriptional regulator, partial [Proteobacteria bacterium]|nr:sigma 54-interacting transcriptional regulator [Pseudomonadota bacterium]